MNGENYMVMIPNEFKCSCCKKTFDTKDNFDYSAIENLTQQEINEMFAAKHPQYLVMCDNCMAVFDNLTGLSSMFEERGSVH